MANGSVVGFVSLLCWVTSLAGNDNYIYAKFKNGIFIFLVLYVNNVLLAQGVIKNLLLETKRFMSSHFDIKDLREVSYVFEIETGHNGYWFYHIKHTYKTFFHVCNCTPATIVKGGKCGND